MPYPPEPIEKIVSIKTTISNGAFREVLSTHGCAICDEKEQGAGLCTVVFPAGTTRQELYPRTMATRFRILLPDGLELREVDNRQERTQLYIVIEDEKKPD